MSEQFTPGPWKPSSRLAFGDGEFAVEAIQPAANGGKVIALTYGPVSEANAHLIAAAPELYAALKALVASMDDLDITAAGNAYEPAVAALAKADDVGVTS